MCRFGMANHFVPKESTALWRQPNVVPKDWAARSVHAGRPDAGRKCKKNNPILEVSNI